MQLGFRRPDGDPQGLRDLPVGPSLGVVQDEDPSSTPRKLPDSRHEIHSIVGPRPRRSPGSVHGVIRLPISTQARTGAAPERGVHRDSMEPSLESGLAPPIRQATPGLNVGLLGHFFGFFGAHEGHEHPVHPAHGRPVEPLEGSQVTVGRKASIRLVPLGCVAPRLGSRLLHAARHHALDPDPPQRVGRKIGKPLEGTAARYPGPMSSKELTLTLASFLDSSESAALGQVPKPAQRTIVERIVQGCIGGLGKAPRLLDEHDIEALLRQALPAQFSPKDPLIDHAAPVVQAYFDHVRTNEVVPMAYEMERGLEAHLPSLTTTLRGGTRAGQAAAPNDKPFVHGAPKLGRNDPCSCGSGKKFKKCHGKGL